LKEKRRREKKEEEEGTFNGTSGGKDERLKVPLFSSLCLCPSSPMEIDPQCLMGYL
jgi:hypothetical protein